MVGFFREKCCFGFRFSYDGSVAVPKLKKKKHQSTPLFTHSQGNLEDTDSFLSSRKLPKSDRQIASFRI